MPYKCIAMIEMSGGFKNPSVQYHPSCFFSCLEDHI